MYIPYQDQQAIHQDMVNDGVTRSELRRMVQEREAVTDTQARRWNPGIALTALVRSMCGVVARP